jgi:NAD(P)-dependent dehydrogenase (short-subunit alcohol dehydrogenase family)
MELGERKVALVTGGRRGIGRGIACSLAEVGFNIGICDLIGGADAAETLRLLAERGADATFIEHDIADSTEREQLLDRVYGRFGRLDCLVNNAGMMCVRGDILDATPEDFDRVLGVNLRGTFFLTQEAARRMIAESSDRPGRSIVTITSANAVMVSPEKSSYCISKSALSMMVQMFGVRLAEHNIAAFEIRPGFIRTDMSAPVREKFTAMIEGGATPIRRWGEADDVGRTVASLATGALPYSIGQPINVDGGLLVHRL